MAPTSNLVLLVLVIAASFGLVLAAPFDDHSSICQSISISDILSASSASCCELLHLAKCLINHCEAGNEHNCVYYMGLVQDKMDSACLEKDLSMEIGQVCRDEASEAAVHWQLWVAVIIVGVILAGLAAWAFKPLITRGLQRYGLMKTSYRPYYEMKSQKTLTEEYE